MKEQLFRKALWIGSALVTSAPLLAAEAADAGGWAKLAALAAHSDGGVRDKVARELERRNRELEESAARANKASEARPCPAANFVPRIHGIA